MTSQPGQQIFTVHILTNILRSKGNNTIKFGQLIEDNIRNIFIQKSFTKCGEESSPRPFPEKLKLSISLDQWSKVVYSPLLLYVKLRTIEIH